MNSVLNGEKVKWRSLTWAEFCVWLQGREVVQARAVDDYVQKLVFSDGFVAELRSTKSDPTGGYSEYTPGSDGHLTPPEVRVSGERVYCAVQVEIWRTQKEASR